MIKKKDIDLMNLNNSIENYIRLSDLKSDSRINELLNEIRIINNSDEYFRLKYYNIMIHNIKIIKSLSEKRYF